MFIFLYSTFYEKIALHSGQIPIIGIGTMYLFGKHNEDSLSLVSWHFGYNVFVGGRCHERSNCFIEPGFIYSEMPSQGLKGCAMIWFGCEIFLDLLGSIDHCLAWLSGRGILKLRDPLTILGDISVDPRDILLLQRFQGGYLLTQGSDLILQRLEGLGYEVLDLFWGHGR